MGRGPGDGAAARRRGPARRLHRPRRGLDTGRRSLAPGRAGLRPAAALCPPPADQGGRHRVSSDAHAAALRGRGPGLPHPRRPGHAGGAGGAGLRALDRHARAAGRDAAGRTPGAGGGLAGAKTLITYQTLFDQFPLPAFLLGPLGEVVLANPSAASLLGLPARPEQLDQPWTLHVGERWVSLVEQIRDALEGRRASFDLLDPRTPDTGVRIPLLCRPLPDDQGGRLLLCTAASEVSPSRAWSSAEEQLHRIRIGEDARRTLQNILVVVRNGLDLDRVLFIERDHPRPGLAAISQESCRAGLEPLADGFPPLGNELYPRQWTPLLQPLAYADLAAINLPRGLQGLVERLSARSLIAVEVRPVEGPSGFLVGLQVASPHPW
ncbi:MAG: PAS domain-containing protein, partial [Deltaproteobacteria bacterium]|nr:PAS domain-containing protein [Deltaproteobacteria bacterium]